MFRIKRHLAAAFLFAGVVGACSSSGATSTPISAAPSTGGGVATAAGSGGSGAVGAAGALGGTIGRGGDFCGLLGPGDFAAVGVIGARTPTKNSDDATDAYCVYSGVSGATGGIEFDIFLTDAANGYQQIKANGGITADDATADLPGVNAAGIQLDGLAHMADIGVLKGTMAFDIDVPTNPNARTQLIALAKLVLQRGGGLSS
jgi:hypothetical protein